MLLSILFAEGDSSILDHVLFFGIFAGVTAVVWFVLRRAEQQAGLADRLEALEGGTALALLSATSLSFVLTATDVGLRVGKLREINATAMVGAAVIAMVLFPLGAQALLARTKTESSAEKS